MQTAPLRFAERAAAGAASRTLADAMASARSGLFAKADLAMSHPHYQSWRDAGMRIRDGALARLDELLEQFEQSATAAGATVHWAADARQAREIVTEIAQSHGADAAIKSKSMLSEEIEINEALEGSGLSVLETDLGEYVIQLAKSRPSHIIAPIIHMTKQQVEEIFAANHQPHPRETSKQLVDEARELLRDRMVNAQLGITGANFLIASSGSAVIVTNEGNGRFCSTAPKVRITLAGIEKVIPSFKELAVLLRLLPRAATGQEATSYVSIGTGTRDNPRLERHHIVLIDNGRSRMLAGKYREMLRCIRCGSCMNHCPVYRIAGGHSYDSVYSGPMGAVLSPQLFGPAHDDLPHGATMCAACTVHCPVKIPLPDLMRNLREDQVQAGRESTLQRIGFAVWMFFAVRPALYAIGVRMATTAMRLLAGSDGRLRWLPGMGGWFADRDLAVPASGPFRTTQASASTKDRS